MPKRPRVKGISFGRGSRIRSIVNQSHVVAHLSITPESWARLKRELEKLDQAVSRAIQEKAVLAGAEIIAREANTNAPGPFIVYDLIDYKPNPALAAAGIGPDDDHWWYRFVELGTTPHDIQGSPIVFQGDTKLFVGFRAQQTGGNIARPFLRPAAEGKSREAQEAMAAVLESEMRKAV